VLYPQLKNINLSKSSGARAAAISPGGVRSAFAPRIAALKLHEL